MQQLSEKFLKVNFVVYFLPHKNFKEKHQYHPSGRSMFLKDGKKFQGKKWPSFHSAVASIANYICKTTKCLKCLASTGNCIRL